MHSLSEIRRSFDPVMSVRTEMVCRASASSAVIRPSVRTDCPGKAADWGFGVNKRLALTLCAAVRSDLVMTSLIGCGLDVGPRILHDLSTIRNPLGRMVGITESENSRSEHVWLSEGSAVLRPLTNRMTKCALRLLFSQRRSPAAYMSRDSEQGAVRDRFVAGFGGA